MTTAGAEIKKTPLRDWHLEAGAKLVDFHGWELPVQYTSIVEEHQAVRKACGLFDISHMGQILVEGEDAFAWVQRMCTNDLSRLEKGLAVYAHLLLPTGGVIDDIYIYAHPSRRGRPPEGPPRTLFLVVNGATQEKDIVWLKKHLTGEVRLTPLENRVGFALQGPKALELLRRVVPFIADLPRFACKEITATHEKESLWACRTGYTGEEGAEFFGPAQATRFLWDQVVKEGAAFGLKPCGLGARDTLRLEMGYPLYGHELSEERTPLEANMAWVVKMEKPDFIGKAALEKQAREGIKEKLVAYRLLERGVPRAGTRLWHGVEGPALTTSGTFSPSLQAGIGLAYMPAAWGKLGTRIEVELHNRRIPAEVVKLPFYKKS